MENLEKDMQELIKKSLPAHLSDTLNERLDLIPKLEKENDSLTKLLNTIRENNNELNNKLQEYMKYASISAGFDQRERELKEKEIKFEVDSLKVKLEAEQYKSQFSKEVVLGLVRNTEYRKEVFNNHAVNGRTGESGMYLQPYNEVNTSTENRKLE